MTPLTIDIERSELETATDIYKAIAKDHCSLISQASVKTKDADNDYEPLFTQAIKNDIRAYTLKVAQLLIVQASSNHGSCGFELFNNPEDIGLSPSEEGK